MSNNDDDVEFEEVEDLEAWIDAPELKSKQPDAGENYAPSGGQSEFKVELYDESYIEESRKKPPVLFLIFIVLLILSVFWKKTIIRVMQPAQPQVEQTVPQTNTSHNNQQ